MQQNTIEGNEMDMDINEGLNEVKPLDILRSARTKSGNTVSPEDAAKYYRSK